MKRQAPAHASSTLNTPANLAYKPGHHSSVQSVSPEETPTAAAFPSLSPHQLDRQSPFSHTPAPYSAGLFGRQHAAKRQHLSDVNMQAASMDSPKASPLATPAAHQGAASPLQDALDRFNARRGNRMSSASAPSKPAQQPLDALDRFNARKGFKQQTNISHKAIAHSSGASLHPAAQAHLNRAPSDPQCRGMMQASVSSQQPSNSAGSQPAQQQHTQRGMDALDRFNRRRGFKASNSSPSPQGADAATQHKSRLHPQARQHAQQPLDALASTLPHPDSHPHRLHSASYQQASEGDVQDTTCEDSQQSQTISLELQHISDLRGIRPAASSVAGFPATHTPDALDRVNSILLARRKSRIGVSAAQVCRTSASPDATVSSAPAQTVDLQVSNQPVDMSLDELKQCSRVQMRQDDAVPSGMYSSRLHPTGYRSSTADLLHMAKVADGASGSARNLSLGRKRMRTCDDGGDDGNAGGAVAKKKAKAVDAVAGLQCHTTGKGARQGNVFDRLAQKCA